MNDKVLPYTRKPSIIPDSLWIRKCDEIDEAADLLDAEGFAKVAATKLQVNIDGDPLAYFDPPSKRQIAEGICPLYEGHINTGGCDSVMVCGGCGKQLHLYVETKLCEQGRKIYCPIWRAKNNDTRKEDENESCKKM